MKIAVKSSASASSWRQAGYSSFQRFSFQHFSSTQSPLFPRNPHFPALQSSLKLRPGRPVRLNGSFRGLPQQANSLQSPKQKDLEDLRMATYAAMVEGMDAGIARVMQAMEKCGRAENTIVIFTSDNGPDSFSVMDKALLKQGMLPGDRNSNFQPGTGWAYATATPWRLYKISQHAGGITAGGIVHWPAGLKQPGRTSHSPVHLIDVMPTLPEAVGAANSSPCDGESFLPLIRNESWKRNGPMFFQYADNRAIRTEAWTLAEVDGNGWELFDPRLDPLECNDLTAKKTEIVSKLETQWLDCWKHHSGTKRYQAESTKGSPHYSPQGDRGSGKPYVPSSMP